MGPVDSASSDGGRSPERSSTLCWSLRTTDEVRKPQSYFDDIPDIKVPADMLKLATHILETKKAHFKPEKFKDRYEDALVELIKAKQAGKAPPIIAEPRQGNVINLMDALRRSAKAERRTPAAKPKASAQRKRPTARRKVKKAG